MPTEAEMKATLQRYLDALNAADADAVVALFAEDAVVMDPYGKAPHEGRAAIAKFFGDVCQSGATATLDTPIRGSYGDRAAMAFTVHVGDDWHIRVIDVMTFDDTGKIIRMEAYWGSGDAGH
ncbi:MAG: nuclear transport factor 2 family protein [Actinoallomurus sp.]